MKQTFDTAQNNKRIAKNTLLLYFRMLFMMAISLFTSRITLSALGITDYGIYNVIGGMVSMFSILSGSLSVAISRFITIGIAKNDEKKLNDIFYTSVSIQLFMAFIICLLAEIAGVWFLNHKMVIPAERLYAAQWVLHLSIITFIIGLISVPYNAVIIAHEKMSAFAYISILEAILKLIIVYFLYISPTDKLIIYAILLTCVSLILRLVYGTYCKRHFPEAHFHPRFNKELLRNMFKFIGWSFWGNGVVVLKDQGSNILLNLFCGPSVNAARGLAMQVNTAVYSFVQNFMTAVNPQITKSFSMNEKENMYKLIIKSAKFGFFILLILLMPIYANIDYVLNFWLIEIPPHTANFIILILFYSLLDCYGNPLITGILADGNIKKYEIILTIIYLTNFLASYFFLKIGFQPEWIFILNIIFKAFVVIALLWHSYIRYTFPVNTFLQECIIKTATAFIICICLIKALPVLTATNLIHFIISTTVIVIFCIAVILMIGINKKEYTYIKGIIRIKLHLEKK